MFCLITTNKKMTAKTISSNLLFLFAGFFICLLLMKKCERIEFSNQPIVYKEKIVKVPKIDTVIWTNTVEEIRNDTFLVRDTIIDTVINYISKNTPKEVLAEIARNYYQINFYNDSIPVDSIGYISIKDSIQSNKIKSRSLEYNFEIPKPQNLGSFLSVGVSAGGNKATFDVGPEVMFTTKNKWSFGYSYQSISNRHFISVKKSIFQFK